MNCGNSECGSDNLYDNRQKVTSGWKGPLWKCKDCGWVKWPPKGQGNGAPRPQNGAAPKRALGPLYNECLDFAKRAVLHHLPNATPSDIIAATATLLIQATRDGSNIYVGKPTPPKPKPAPPPEPEPEYQDESEYDDANSLPF